MIEPLSERQRQIMNYAVEGYYNSEIATALGISKGSVQQHMNRTLRKMKTRNKLQTAVVYKLEQEAERIRGMTPD